MEGGMVQLKCLLGWYQTHEGREVMMSLMERNLQKRKMFGLLAQPTFPGRHNVHRTGIVHKVFIMGKSGVGKTSTVCHLAGTDVPETHSETPGIQVSSVYWPIKMSGQENVLVFHLQFWDAGEAALKKFDHVAPVCYEGVDLAIVLFSFTDKSSFQDVNNLLGRITGVPKLVIGTKSDLTAHVEVSQQDVSDFESQHDVKVMRLHNLPHDLQGMPYADVINVAPVLCQLCEMLCDTQPGLTAHQRDGVVT